MFGMCPQIGLWHLTPQGLTPSAQRQLFTGLWHPTVVAWAAQVKPSGDTYAMSQEDTELKLPGSALSEQKSRWTLSVPLTDTSFPVPMSLDFSEHSVDPLALTCSVLLHVIFILPRLLCGCDCCMAALDCFCMLWLLVP